MSQAFVGLPLEPLLECCVRLEPFVELETELQRVKQRLEELWQQVPEEEGRRAYERLLYLPNGLCYHTQSNQAVILSPWVSETTAETADDTPLGEVLQQRELAQPSPARARSTTRRRSVNGGKAHYRLLADELSPLVYLQSCVERGRLTQGLATLKSAVPTAQQVQACLHLWDEAGEESLRLQEVQRAHHVLNAFLGLSKFLRSNAAVQYEAKLYYLSTSGLQACHATLRGHATKAEQCRALQQLRHNTIIPYTVQGAQGWSNGRWYISAPLLRDVMRVLSTQCRPADVPLLNRVGLYVPPAS